MTPALEDFVNRSSKGRLPMARCQARLKQHKTKTQDGAKGDLRGAVRAHQESPGKPAKVRENEVDKAKKMGLMVRLPAPLFDVVLVVLRHLKYA